MSRSFRAIWAAEEAGLDYEYIEVKMGSAEENGTLSDDYRALNPEGKVPTLVGDFGEATPLVLRESAAIVNYLARKAPDKHLLPVEGSALQAHHEEMCFFILTELEQPLWTAGKHKFAIPAEYRVPEVLTKTVAFEFAKAQETLRKLKGDHVYALGDRFSTADILLAHTLNWAEKFRFDVHQDLLTYRDAMFERPAFARAKVKLKG